MRLTPQEVDVMARGLIAEAEAFLEQQADRCPQFRVIAGKLFRCKYTVGKCTGSHYMVYVGTE